MNYKNSRISVLNPIIYAVLLIVGVIIGITFFSPTSNNSSTIFSLPQQNKLSIVLNLIDENYVDTVDKNLLVEMAIPLLLRQLDPHSSYIPASTAEEIQAPLDGNFDGIGIHYNIQNDTIIVVNTIAGGPAEKVGLKSGDRIVFIDDSLFVFKGLKNSDVTSSLKGHSGTKVKVRVKRRSVAELLEFQITRGPIPIKSIDVGYMLNDFVGYVKISRFAKTTYDEFVETVQPMLSDGMQTIVLDLRSNTGGYLDIAIKLADEFLEADKLIVYTQGKDAEKDEYFSTKRGLCKNIHVILLQNSWSASASEVLAGALQDNDKGTIVGQRSFGKGLVQNPIQFEDGSVMRLTIARYYTPTGRCIQKPYNEGAEKYENDIYERMVNSELLDVDSIHIGDSLKYVTPAGKVVYGGGGITPDVFLPRDTSGITDFVSDITRRGIDYDYAFKFADNNREKLKDIISWKAVIEEMQKSDFYSDFIQFAIKQGLTPSASEVELSRSILEFRIMAYIGRVLLDDAGFYPIIHKIDNTLKQTIKIAKKNA